MTAAHLYYLTLVFWSMAFIKATLLVFSKELQLERRNLIKQLPHSQLPPFNCYFNSLANSSAAPDVRAKNINMTFASASTRPSSQMDAVHHIRTQYENAVSPSALTPEAVRYRFAAFACA